MIRRKIVEVACDVEFEDLDDADTAFDGSCAVDGSYLITLTDLPEGIGEGEIDSLALDSFHKTVVISCLDDFSILTRDANVGDTEGGLRSHWDASYNDLEVASAGGASQDHNSGLPEPTPYGGSSGDDPFAE